MNLKTLCLLALAAACAASGSAAAESTCYGTVARGRIEGAVQLPEQGPNFQAYSGLGVALGRTFAHSTVVRILLRAYEETQRVLPSTTFVYGETGWRSGGPFRPHRTHQNGLSVDFMAPVRDAQGRSVPLPTSVGNRFGYGIEFDRGGQYEALSIDFDAMGEHLFQLHRAAIAQGAGLSRVILDTDYLPKLYASRHGSYLKAHLPIMKKKPWIRHDDHYHLDFAIACKPLSARD